MIEAKFCITTPLFMGGADPKRPELRVSGIKGALRFWWRALAWSWYKGDLNEIRDQEGRIFGSTKHGQSRVIMDISGVHAKAENDNFFKSRQGLMGLMYLGYGLIDNNKLTREYLEPPVDATLRIQIRPDRGKDPVDESKITDQISNALIAMGLFGGLGSRSRRGFGSFNLIGLNVNGERKFSCPENRSQLNKTIKELFEGLNPYKELPEYTAFGARSEVYIFNGNSNNPRELLDKVGKNMQEYRLGRRGRPNSRSSASIFKKDTELAKRALKSTVNEHPRRLFFGLPHNYHFQYGNLEIRGEEHDRRASPLLIHVQMLGTQCVDTQYAAVAALMPARFLPSDEKIQMIPRRGRDDKREYRHPVDLDKKEAEELTVIANFLRQMSWEKVV